MPSRRRSVHRPTGRTRSPFPYDAFCDRGISKDARQVGQVHDPAGAVRSERRLLPGLQQEAIRVPLQLRGRGARSVPRDDGPAVQRRHSVREGPEGHSGHGHPAAGGRLADTAAVPRIRHPVRATGPVHAGADPRPVPSRQGPRRRPGGRAGVLLPDVRAAGGSRRPIATGSNRRASRWARRRGGPGAIPAIRRDGPSAGSITSPPTASPPRITTARSCRATSCSPTECRPRCPSSRASYRWPPPRRTRTWPFSREPTWCRSCIWLWPADAERAQQLAGHRIVFSAYEDEFGVDSVADGYRRPSGRRGRGRNPATQASCAPEHLARWRPSTRSAYPRKGCTPRTSSTWAARRPTSASCGRPCPTIPPGRLR